MGVVSLIVMEPGSAWPGHVRDSENIVAASYRDEGLLQRTRRTLAALRGRGQQVRVAVLACSHATDVASLARRAQLAHELLAAVAAAGFGASCSAPRSRRPFLCGASCCLSRGC